MILSMIRVNSINFFLLLSCYVLISNASPHRYLRRNAINKSGRTLSESVEDNEEKDDCDICVLPKGVGTCRGMHPRWYYYRGKCELFFFGGCMEGGGNANNFETPEACEARCAACSNRTTQNDTLINEIFQSTAIDQFHSSDYNIESLEPSLTLSTSPSLLETSPMDDSTTQDGSDSVSSIGVEQKDEESNMNTKLPNKNVKDGGFLRVESFILEKSLTKISFFASEEYPEAAGATDQNEVIEDENDPQEDGILGLKVHPQCHISPLSASLENAENHMVYIHPKKENDDEEDNDLTTAMTCKEIQLGGIAGLIPEEDCSRIKTSLACPFVWPELIGEAGEKAKIIIQKEINDMMPETWNNQIKIIVIERNSWFSNFDWTSLSAYIQPPSTIESLKKDAYYQSDRIIIYVDHESKVVTAPQIG